MIPGGIEPWMFVNFRQRPLQLTDSNLLEWPINLTWLDLVTFHVVSKLFQRGREWKYLSYYILHTSALIFWVSYISHTSALIFWVSIWCNTFLVQNTTDMFRKLPESISVPLTPMECQINILPIWLFIEGTYSLEFSNCPRCPRMLNHNFQGPPD